MPPLDIWDYLTFLSFFILAVGGLATVVFVLGLPGRIARARNHPDADAINLMGWLGFMLIIPWVQAFLWAFKPTDVIDIRRFPREEKEFLSEQAARFRGEATPQPPQEPKSVKPPTAGGEHS